MAGNAPRRPEATTRQLSALLVALTLSTSACVEVEENASSGGAPLTSVGKLELDAVAPAPRCLAPRDDGTFNIHPSHQYLAFYFGTRRPNVPSDKLLSEAVSASASLEFVVANAGKEETYPVPSPAIITASVADFPLAGMEKRPPHGSYAKARVNVEIDGETHTVETKRIFRFVPAGDVDGDGLFGSSDLVTLFQAGTYEKEQLAGPCEGDMDGDQRFTSSDLVAMAQDSPYEDPGGAAKAKTVPPDGPAPELLVADDKASWPSALRSHDSGAVCGLVQAIAPGEGSRGFSTELHTSPIWEALDGPHATSENKICWNARWWEVSEEWTSTPDYSPPALTKGNAYESDVTFDSNYCSGGDLGVPGNGAVPGQISVTHQCVDKKSVDARCLYFGAAADSCVVEAQSEFSGRTSARAKTDPIDEGVARASAELDFHVRQLDTGGVEVSHAKSEADAKSSTLWEKLWPWAKEHTYVEAFCSFDLQKGFNCTTKLGMKATLAEMSELIASDSQQPWHSIDLTYSRNYDEDVNAVVLHRDADARPLGIVGVSAKAQYDLVSENWFDDLVSHAEADVAARGKGSLRVLRVRRPGALSADGSFACIGPSPNLSRELRTHVRVDCTGYPEWAAAAP